jgi:phenylalanyl-tRNA synthetase beta chain
MKLEAYSDIYSEQQKQIEIDFDLDFINRLIGKKYSLDTAKKILKNLGIEIINNKLKIPSWRKELNYKADIAEEIARIDGYDKIEAKIPEIQL